jgi:hypothetical protein
MGSVWVCERVSFSSVEALAVASVERSEAVYSGRE